MEAMTYAVKNEEIGLWFSSTANIFNVLIIALHAD